MVNQLGNASRAPLPPLLALLAFLLLFNPRRNDPPNPDGSSSVTARYEVVAPSTRRRPREGGERPRGGRRLFGSRRRRQREQEVGRSRRIGKREYLQCEPVFKLVVSGMLDSRGNVYGRCRLTEMVPLGSRETAKTRPHQSSLHQVSLLMPLSPLPPAAPTRPFASPPVASPDDEDGFSSSLGRLTLTS